MTQKSLVWHHIPGWGAKPGSFVLQQQSHPTSGRQEPEPSVHKRWGCEESSQLQNSWEWTSPRTKHTPPLSSVKHNNTFTFEKVEESRAFSRLPPQLLPTTLTSNITVWYGSCTEQDQRALQCVLRTAQNITSTQLPAAVRTSTCPDVSAGRLRLSETPLILHTTSLNSSPLADVQGFALTHHKAVEQLLSPSCERTEQCKTHTPAQNKCSLATQTL